MKSFKTANGKYKVAPTMDKPNTPWGAFFGEIVASENPSEIGRKLTYMKNGEYAFSCRGLDLVGVGNGLV